MSLFITLKAIKSIFMWSLFKVNISFHHTHTHAQIQIKNNEMIMSLIELHDQKAILSFPLVVKKLKTLDFIYNLCARSSIRITWLSLLELANFHRKKRKIYRLIKRIKPIQLWNYNELGKYLCKVKPIDYKNWVHKIIYINIF